MDMNLRNTDGTERTVELRAFLLGTLADTDAERLEYSLLSDDGLYELLLATEEELIDEYLGGSLTQSEASSFLGYLEKVPGGTRRIDFARHFRKSLETSEALTPAGSRWQAALSGFASMWRWQRPAFAASLLLGVLALAIYTSTSRTGEDPFVVLTAGLTRSAGEVPTVTLSPSRRVVTAMLDLGAHSHERYRATLRDADSRPIHVSGRLTASVTDRRVLVPFPLPLTGLEPGDYSISLDGETASGLYESIETYVLRFVE